MNTEKTQALLLDQYLDALQHDANAAPPTDLDPALAAQARQVQAALTAPPLTTPDMARLWTRVQAQHGKDEAIQLDLTDTTHVHTQPEEIMATLLTAPIPKPQPRPTSSLVMIAGIAAALILISALVVFAQRNLNPPPDQTFGAYLQGGSPSPTQSSSATTVPALDPLYQTATAYADSLTPPALLGGLAPYEVQPGDTLLSIVIDFNVLPNALFSANPNVDWENLQPGQRLTIPLEYRVEGNIEDTLGVMTGEVYPTEVPPMPVDPIFQTATAVILGATRAAVLSSETVAYTVQPYDTAFSIARQFNINANDLAAANPNIDLEQITVGTALLIPLGSAVTITPVGSFPQTATALSLFGMNAPVEQPAPIDAFVQTATAVILQATGDMEGAFQTATAVIAESTRTAVPDANLTPLPTVVPPQFESDFNATATAYFASVTDSVNMTATLTPLPTTVPTLDETSASALTATQVFADANATLNALRGITQTPVYYVPTNEFPVIASQNYLCMVEVVETTSALSSISSDAFGAGNLNAGTHAAVIDIEIDDDGTRWYQLLVQLRGYLVVGWVTADQVVESSMPCPQEDYRELPTVVAPSSTPTILLTSVPPSPTFTPLPTSTPAPSSVLNTDVGSLCVVEVTQAPLIIRGNRDRSTSPIGRLDAEAQAAVIEIYRAPDDTLWYRIRVQMGGLQLTGWVIADYVAPVADPCPQLDSATVNTAAVLPQIVPTTVSSGVQTPTMAAVTDVQTSNTPCTVEVAGDTSVVIYERVAFREIGQVAPGTRGHIVGMEELNNGELWYRVRFEQNSVQMTGMVLAELLTEITPCPMLERRAAINLTLTARATATPG